MKRLAAAVVVAGACVVAVPWGMPRSQGGDDTGLKEDLDKLQGTWELVANTAVVGGKPARSVQQITGNKTTVTRYDGSGKVVGAHSADIKLTRVGKVNVCSFSNMRIVAGPGKGTTVTGPGGRGAFIYRVVGDTFYEVAGFLEGEDYGRKQPYTGVWKRVRE